MTATCEALYGVLADDAETCGRPGAEFHVIGCVHEHIDKMYICSECISRVVKCMECHDLGHDECPMMVLK